MDSIEAVGKNVEQAIENGLLELGTTRDKVTIEVKETGGFFKKARVVLTVDGDLKSKNERAENIKRLEELEQKGELDSDFSNMLKTDKTTAKNAENQDVLDCEKTKEKCVETSKNCGNAGLNTAGEEVVLSGKEIINSAYVQNAGEMHTSGADVVAQDAETDSAEMVQCATIGAEEFATSGECETSGISENTSTKSCAEEVVECGCGGKEKELTRGASKIKEFADNVLKLMGVNACVEICETGDNINAEVVGTQANKVIGKRGDGLNALQYLCSVVGSRCDRDCGRVYVNACGYKEEREQELIKLARKLKYSALREEREVKLEPMCALDRKTIHKALKDDDAVETHSEGEEPRRYIVITPKSQG